MTGARADCNKPFFQSKGKLMSTLKQIVLYAAVAAVSLAAGIWVRTHFSSIPQIPLTNEISQQGAQAILATHETYLGRVNQSKLEKAVVPLLKQNVKTEPLTQAQ
jgi:hypothetical protein